MIVVTKLGKTGSEGRKLMERRNREDVSRVETLWSNDSCRGFCCCHDP